MHYFGTFFSIIFEGKGASEAGPLFSVLVPVVRISNHAGTAMTDRSVQMSILMRMRLLLRLIIVATAAVIVVVGIVA